MDLQGSLVDTNVRIYPSFTLLKYLETISDNAPINILKIVNGDDYKPKKEDLVNDVKPLVINFNDDEINTLKKIREAVNKAEAVNSEETHPEKKEQNGESTDVSIKENHDKSNEENTGTLGGPYLTTSDLDWLYIHLQKQRQNGANNVPYLYVLLQGSNIELPDNQKLKRNPILEARCVKLRAQQEAREYRKMTKGVDNVRMRFPEDSISYQLKQVNRQLIAIGQFIISIFAGFLFGFRGVEWMVGNLDFGFRLLLGVMCALVIALAEIYFLAKKLNEELNIPETVQLGGPPKFAHENEPPYMKTISNSDMNKEHQD